MGPTLGPITGPSLKDSTDPGLVQTLVDVHSLTAMHMNTNKFSRNEDKRRLTKSGEENRVFSMTSTGRRDTGETASNKS